MRELLDRDYLQSLILELEVLGTQELATLLSTDRARQIQIIQSQVNEEAKNFGINIVDVRIKRADLPQQTVKQFINVCKLKENVRQKNLEHKVLR